MILLFRALILVFVAAVLGGCASVVPPDVFAFENFSQREYVDSVTQHTMLSPSPTCMEKIQEFECGHGVSIMTGQEIFVGEKKEHWFNGKPWSELHAESVELPAEESYAPLATYVINSCKQNNCSSQVTKFQVKLGPINAVQGVPSNSK